VKQKITLKHQKETIIWIANHGCYDLSVSFLNIFFKKKKQIKGYVYEVLQVIDIISLKHKKETIIWTANHGCYDFSESLNNFFRTGTCTYEVLQVIDILETQEKQTLNHDHDC